METYSSCSFADAEGFPVPWWLKTTSTVYVDQYLWSDSKRLVFSRAMADIFSFYTGKTISSIEVVKAISFGVGSNYKINFDYLNTKLDLRPRDWTELPLTKENVAEAQKKMEVLLQHGVQNKQQHCVKRSRSVWMTDAATSTTEDQGDEKRLRDVELMWGCSMTQQ